MINFLHSLISFFIAIFFIMLGIIGMMVPWSSTIRDQAVALIQQHSITIFLFGFSFAAIGIAVAFNILLNSKKSYYQFKVAEDLVSVDETIIQEYLQGYWKELFPENEIPSRLIVKHNKIHVIAEFPYMEIEEQRRLLEKIQRELREIFANLLDYRQQFQLSVSFMRNPSRK